MSATSHPVYPPLPRPRHPDLSDTDFEFLFGMHIDQFLELPQWKQTAARKKLGLF